MINSRIYDPFIARFLSPDNFVQSAGYSQNFNRYSYAFNNPLKYTDPSGYISIAAIIDFLLGSGGGEYGGTWNADDASPTIFTSQNDADQTVGGTDDPPSKEDATAGGGDGLSLEMKVFAALIHTGVISTPFAGAVAISVDIGIVVGGNEIDTGYFFILAGVDAGKVIGYGEGANGFAPEATAVGEISVINYDGDASDFTSAMLFGDRNKAWLGGGKGVSVSVGYSWSNNGISSWSFSLGGGDGSPISGGYNYGSIYHWQYKK